MATREEDIRAALEELKSAPNATLAGVSKKYGIPRMTLRHRRDGRIPHATAHQASQKLLPVDEEALVTWILQQAAVGNAPGLERTRAMALKILQLRNPG